jgi:hypothetical protein
MPMEEAYFCMFSSAVPSQLVPSITHAFPDEVAHIVDWASLQCGLLWGQVVK